ncbi:FHA domain-containing protein [Achromobacter arsenitoxydans]|uniref:FHA domain-containing protein n=1 Tax=Achromobacter arsenitoxydans SY8 TaxID=477184 RepID=H0FG21_9BURK|nr:FHA domain-containing protein [Achromobacter arsenitoxydans]EHK62814.1 FHA domain-containing protein [Achromobacter arsenitoxydans SY8]
MKFTVFQHAGDPAFEPLHAEFAAPGGTVGRSPDNQLALPDPTRTICRVQAAIRLNDADAAFLENLSAMSVVSVNGRVVPSGQEVPINPGDELEIGAYRLRAEAGIGPAEPPHPAAAPDDDIFGDLIGPGTLPVGAAPDVSVHPFDLESAQTRNPDDPLQHLPRGDAAVSRPAVDPLAMFDVSSDGPPSVFEDTTPSTLPVHDPLAGHRAHPVSEALERPRDAADTHSASDHVREIGGFLRPASVKKPTGGQGG